MTNPRSEPHLRPTFSDVLLPGNRNDAVVSAWLSGVGDYYGALYSPDNAQGASYDFTASSDQALRGIVQLAAVFRYDAYGTHLVQSSIDRIVNSSRDRFFDEEVEKFFIDGDAEQLLLSSVVAVIQQQRYEESVQ